MALRALRVRGRAGREGRGGGRGAQVGLSPSSGPCSILSSEKEEEEKEEPSGSFQQFLFQIQLFW